MHSKLLILACLCARMSAAITYVQSAISTNPGQGTTWTVSMTPTAGNFIHVSCMSAVPTNPTLTIADNKSNTYTQSNAALNSSGWSYDVQIKAWHSPNISGTGSFTWTCTSTSSSSQLTVAVAEYSGMAASSALDQVNTGSGSSTAPATASVTTTQTDELLVATLATQTAPSYTAGSGYTFRRTDTTGVPCGIEDRIVASTGSYTGSATLGSTSPWIIAIATYKASAGGGTGTSRMLQMGVGP